MMEPKTEELAPYFRDGLLYLPNRAIELLIKAGINAEIVEATRNGLPMEDGFSVAEISSAMEDLLATIMRGSGEAKI